MRSGSASEDGATRVGPTVDSDHTDRRVVQRALRAGGVVTVVLGVLMTVLVIIAGGGGSVGLAAMLGALTLGALTTTAWLLLSLFFDLLAGDRPRRRRLWWALGTGAFAFICPVFVLGALSAAAT